MQPAERELPPPLGRIGKPRRLPGKAGFDLLGEAKQKVRERTKTCERFPFLVSHLTATPIRPGRHPSSKLPGLWARRTGGLNTGNSSKSSVGRAPFQWD